MKRKKNRGKNLFGIMSLNMSRVPCGKGYFCMKGYTACFDFFRKRQKDTHFFEKTTEVLQMCSGTNPEGFFPSTLDVYQRTDVTLGHSFKMVSSQVNSSVQKKKKEYKLETFLRSNQDTCLNHKPAVFEGDWIQSGDLLTDCANSVGGELALGQNIFIAYMPWEGYNFEDAFLISERLVTDNVFTSVHIERYEIETLSNTATERMTFSKEENVFLTQGYSDKTSCSKRRIAEFLPKRRSPFLVPSPNLRKNLNQKKGFKKTERLSPQVHKKTPRSKTSKEKGNKKEVYSPKRTSFFNEPYEQITRNVPNVSPKDISHLDSFGIVKKGSWIEEGDILVGKKTPLHKKELTSYHLLLSTVLNKELQPYRDTSLRAPKGIKAKVIDIKLFLKANPVLKPKKRNSSKSLKDLVHSSGVFSPISEGKVSQSFEKRPEQHFIRGAEAPRMKCCLGACQKPFRIVRINGSFFSTGLSNSFLAQKKYSFWERVSRKKQSLFSLRTFRTLQKSERIHIYLAEKRQIQVGDKMSGRHGNKGIVSQILPVYDMPFLPDGTPIDMLLNPLGVPSRMNVGQIYECLLGLAGKYLGENYKIPSFDEIYGAEASRSFVLSKLYEAQGKTGLKWLFNPFSPGKIRLFDGRTGNTFDQPITVGQSYMLRLVHMVDDKIHRRSTGPYSLVTQQPLRGRSKQGGQRLGEMEVWALEGYGAAFTLLEMLTIKSDDLAGRMTLWSNFILNKDLIIGTPEAFKVFICELQALCIDIGLFRSQKRTLGSNTYKVLTRKQHV